MLISPDYLQPLHEAGWLCGRQCIDEHIPTCGTVHPPRRDEVVPTIERGPRRSAASRLPLRQAISYSPATGSRGQGRA
jgi:hypothetical protein